MRILLTVHRTAYPYVQYMRVSCVHLVFAVGGLVMRTDISAGCMYMALVMAEGLGLNSTVMASFLLVVLWFVLLLNNELSNP